MKKLLLGALLVVGATSFAVEEVLTESPANTWSGRTSLTLNAQGNILDATDKPVLVVEPDVLGTDTDALEFNFNNLMMNGKPQTVVAGFEARIEVNGKSLALADDAIAASLSGGDEINATTGNIKIDLKDIGDATASIGELVYSLNFDPVGPQGARVAFDGQVAATVTPATNQTGTFQNTAGKVDVSVENFSYTHPQP